MRGRKMRPAPGGGPSLTDGCRLVAAIEGGPRQPEVGHRVERIDLDHRPEGCGRLGRPSQGQEGVAPLEVEGRLAARLNP
jgi:hypothetical protein